LSVLLGDDQWFFGADGPGMFDAEVFAYTWLILDETLQLKSGISEPLMGLENLLRHRQTLYRRCWSVSNG
jgi:metaxin